ncbi:hypothetical protein ACFX14_020254 [Malus domestica]
MTQSIGEEIRRALGRLVAVDCPREGICFGQFMRIKVGVNVLKPMRRALCLRLSTLEGRDMLDVLLQYERLPAYCYWRGLMDHASELGSDDEEAMDSKNKIIEGLGDGGLGKVDLTKTVLVGMDVVSGDQWEV